MDSHSDSALYEARVQALQKRFAYQFSGEHIGFEIEPGWLDLVEKTCAEVDQCLSGCERERFYWRQIKEKVGGLRMYYAGGPLRIDILNESKITSLKSDTKHGDPVGEIVSLAEVSSFEICAVCGAKGQLRTDRSWVRTLCDQHANDGACGWQLR